jgi:hypothetical protein
MKISIGQDGDKVNFEAVDVRDIRELSELILKSPYSLGIFKDNYRTKANFVQAEAIGLDFDEGMSLAEATELFKDYSHIIAPSRSHQVEKNGKVCDRFRVILILSEPITDAKVFEATWFELFKQFPKLDKACKDASRFFYPSKSVHSVKSGGLRVQPVDPEFLGFTEYNPPLITQFPSEEKGELGKATLKFLQFGAPHGERHRELYKAARDVNQQGYSFEEFVEWVNDLCERVGDDAYRDKGALKAIQDAFTKEPKHEPRIEKKAFELKKIGQLYEDKTEVEWLVEGLLTKGGVSLMSADPKAGKSTLVRQLMRDVLRGSLFLNRRCKQGQVYYFAIEEQIQVINASFKRLGVTAEDDLFVHVGDPLTENGFKDFKELIVSQRPALAVIDTLFDLLEVESENNYKEVKRGLRAIRQIARESGTHILLVHHSSKQMKDDKRRGNRAILGSQAIAGGVDTVIILEVDSTSRYITTSGREISKWDYHEIIWDERTKTYSLGAKKEEDLY